MKVKETKTIEVLKIGQTTSHSLLKHTQKSWNDWIHILNSVGAEVWSHQEIVRHLKIKYKLSAWWQQVVASGYEVHIGRRQQGQNLMGLYTVTKTKTINTVQKELWKFMNSPKGIEIWLKPLSRFEVRLKNCFEVMGEIYGEVRSMKSPSKIRLSWSDSDWSKKSYVQIRILPRPKNKSMLVIQHEKLESLRNKQKMSEYWGLIVNEIANQF